MRPIYVDKNNPKKYQINAPFEDGIELPDQYTLHDLPFLSVSSRQELVETYTVPELVFDQNGDPVYETDANGNTVYMEDESGEQLFDQDSNPIPVQETQDVQKEVYKTVYDWALDTQAKQDAEDARLQEQQEAQTKQARQDKINMRKRAIERGQEVIALMASLNDDKPVTEQQVNDMMSNPGVQQAVGLLQVGSLVTAKTVILSLDLSGIVATEDDRSEIVAAIDDYIADL